MQTINQQLVSRRKSATLVLVAIATVAISVGHGQTQVVNNSTGQYPQQQQQQPAAAAVPLQAQLGQIQQQAQRQLSQLNGLVMKAVNNSSGRYSNVLEAISSVGKVIHQQISAATNPNHVNIVTGNGATDGAGSNMVGQIGESANSKKNEYQSIQMQGTELGGPNSYGGPVPPPPPMMMMMNSNGSSISQGNANYREQGEFLRQEITRRAGQLQQVVASSMELLKNNGDMIMRRLLEQMNVRLDQAKAKADKIISNEPLAMNEVTVKALATINTGLNNLNNIIANIVARMDLANKQDQQQQRNSQGGGAGSGVGGPLTLQQRLQQAASDPASGRQLLDTSRLKANLQQLSQQFQQALNGSSLHQQLALIRQQRLQQLAALGGGNSVVGSSNQQRASPPTTDLLSNRNNNPTAQDQQQPAQAQYNQQQ